MEQFTYIGLTFSRDEVTTVFPVIIGPANDLGIFDSSFTAMAWVFSDPVQASAGGRDYTIFGTDEAETNKGLNLKVCLSTKRT